MTRAKPSILLPAAALCLASCTGTLERLLPTEEQSAPPAPAPPAECPHFDDTVELGRVPSPGLAQVSGIAHSTAHSEVLWAHNDAGDGPRLFALDETGERIATLHIRGAAARDWEDIAIGRGPGGRGAYLYIADIGDTARVRSQYQIYRVREPDLRVHPRGSILRTTAERMNVVYPRGPRDAETLLIDPKTQQLAVILKGPAEDTWVYGLGTFSPGATRHAVPLLRVNRPEMKDANVQSTPITAGDVSPDGQAIVLVWSGDDCREDGAAGCTEEQRGRNDIGKLWRKPAEGSLWDAFATEPCQVDVPDASGGTHAVAFAANGSGLYTLQRGGGSALMFTHRLPDSLKSAGPVVETLYEAEGRQAQRGCQQRSNHQGYSGAGFIDFGGQGSWIEWNAVQVRTGGVHELSFRYANGSDTDRSARILVNGRNASNVSFDSTGGWSNWGHQSVRVRLQAGRNTIRVRANSGRGGPNLDMLTVAGAAHSSDLCPSDPLKTEPGVCGCGVRDTDRDGDRLLDCFDGCPTDGDKTSPGSCGCGTGDDDADGDGMPDCNDVCPEDPDKQQAGICGCGRPDDDSDGDGTADCQDTCPHDANKTEPGRCGCGHSEDACAPQQSRQAPPAPGVLARRGTDLGPPCATDSAPAAVPEQASCAAPASGAAALIVGVGTE